MIESAEDEAGSSQLERIQRILEKAKGKNLFADIEDPSKWQCQIRSEWEQDYTNINTTIPPSGGQGA